MLLRCAKNFPAIGKLKNIDLLLCDFACSHIKSIIFILDIETAPSPFNIKMPSNRNITTFHCYLHSGISYTGTMDALFCGLFILITALIAMLLPPCEVCYYIARGSRPKSPWSLAGLARSQGSYVMARLFVAWVCQNLSNPPSWRRWLIKGAWLEHNYS